MVPAKEVRGSARWCSCACALVCSLPPVPLVAVVPAEWKVGVWGDCSRACGGGMRNRSVTCVDVEDHVVPITECPSIMPLRDSVCNLQACAPIPVGDNGFSCNGINPCPIISQQGGSLSIRVTGAQNLPDLDGWGAAGGDSDPMVTITITGSTRSSGTAGPVITADAAPTRRWEWSSSNNEMVFGFKETLSTMDVAVWDKDSGLEGADDTILVVSHR